MAGAKNFFDIDSAEALLIESDDISTAGAILRIVCKEIDLEALAEVYYEPLEVVVTAYTVLVSYAAASAGVYCLRHALLRMQLFEFFQGEIQDPDFSSAGPSDESSSAQSYADDAVENDSFTEEGAHTFYWLFQFLLGCYSFLEYINSSTLRPTGSSYDGYDACSVAYWQLAFLYRPFSLPFFYCMMNYLAFDSEFKQLVEKGAESLAAKQKDSGAAVGEGEKRGSTIKSWFLTFFTRYSTDRRIEKKVVNRYYERPNVMKCLSLLTRFTFIFCYCTAILPQLPLILAFSPALAALHYFVLGLGLSLTMAICYAAVVILPLCLDGKMGWRRGRLECLKYAINSVFGLANNADSESLSARIKAWLSLSKHGKRIVGFLDMPGEWAKGFVGRMITAAKKAGEKVVESEVDKAARKKKRLFMTSLKSRLSFSLTIITLIYPLMMIPFYVDSSPDVYGRICELVAKATQKMFGISLNFAWLKWPDLSLSFDFDVFVGFSVLALSKVHLVWAVVYKVDKRNRASTRVHCCFCCKKKAKVPDGTWRDDASAKAVRMSGSWLTASVLVNGKRRQLKTKVVPGQKYAFNGGKFVAIGGSQQKQQQTRKSSKQGGGGGLSNAKEITATIGRKASKVGAQLVGKVKVISGPPSSATTATTKKKTNKVLPTDE